MSVFTIPIVAIICWAIVAIVNGPKGKRKDKNDAEQLNQINKLERDVATMRERIETLERIVTDEKYDLNRQFDDLKKSKVA